MLKNIFWGIASLDAENIEKYISRENKDKKFNDFSFYIREKNFFIRSNFTTTKEIILYQHIKDISNFKYGQKFLLPQIKIVNNEQSIAFYSDTFGLNTLYWIQLDTTVIFSNSSYFLAKMLKRSPLGIKGLFIHLILRGLANNASYYEGIFQIPPQSILTLDNTGIKISKRKVNAPSNIALKDLLLKDIPNKIIFDSGISFSGGIDSSIIVSEVISKCENITCYSLINLNNTNLKRDLHFANLLAEQMNFTVKKVPFKLYEDILYYDMPILDHDVYGQYCLAKYMLHDEKKYMISGSGADELFGGYDRIFYYAHSLKNRCYKDQLDYILQRYSYTDFELLKKIDSELFINVYNDIKKYYFHIVETFSNPVTQLHYWFIYHHLFWILKMQPRDIKCLFPYLREEFLSFCLQTDYKVIFPYVMYKQSDPSYHLKVKNVIKEQYQHLLPVEILGRQKLPFSVQETEINTWYELQYQKNNPDCLIPYHFLEEIMAGKYGNQTKLLFLSYILWRQRVI